MARRHRSDLGLREISLSLLQLQHLELEEGDRREVHRIYYCVELKHHGGCKAAATRCMKHHLDHAVFAGEL